MNFSWSLHHVLRKIPNPSINIFTNCIMHFKEWKIINRQWAVTGLIKVNLPAWDNNFVFHHCGFEATFNYNFKKLSFSDPYLSWTQILTGSLSFFTLRRPNTGFILCSGVLALKKTPQICQNYNMSERSQYQNFQNTILQYH